MGLIGVDSAHETPQMTVLKLIVMLWVPWAIYSTSTKCGAHGAYRYKYTFTSSDLDIMCSSKMMRMLQVLSELHKCLPVLQIQTICTVSFFKICKFYCSWISMRTSQSSSSVSMKMSTFSGEYVAPCNIYPLVLMHLNAFVKHCKSVSSSHGPSLIWMQRVMPMFMMKMLGGWESNRSNGLKNPY